MNQTLLAVIVGLLAGAAGAFTVHLLGPERPGAAAGASGDLQSVNERLAGIEQALAAIRNPPGTLMTRAPAEATGGPGALVGGEAAVEALLARIDERVGKTLDTRMEALKEDRAEGERGRRGRAGRKRVALADAARELQLTAAQEDELRRIFEENQAKLFKMLSEPDGDPEEIRREVMEAAQTPGAAPKIVAKYMPKFLTKIGDIMVLQAERESAIQKAVGPEKAAILERDFSIKEDDILGMRGGASVNVEASGN